MSRKEIYDEARILLFISDLGHCLRVPEVMLTGEKS